MIVKNANDVDCVTLRQGMYQQILIGENDYAPNFIMRLFTIEKDTEVICHIHPWEHEIFVLEGTGAVITPEGRELNVSRGSVLFILKGEKHAMVNKGESALKFLCLVPKVKDESQLKLVSCS